MEAQQTGTEQLSVPFVHNTNEDRHICEIAAILNRAGKHRLAHAPWQDRYPSRANVQFTVAYGSDYIYLQYNVEEPVVLAAYGKNNNPVYKDSCVEAFFSFDGGATYYNFEFNAIGTVLAAYGAAKESRDYLPDALLEQIQSQSVIRKEGRGTMVNWQFTVAIPFTVFVHQPFTSLDGQACSANFYKCGDNLPEPHFLCWSPVQSKEPNFHLPQFFGKLLFVPGLEN
ncbi:MAG TPA: carbohydrate-binding family 9-like protein [Flavisolibacter sp.]